MFIHLQWTIQNRLRNSSFYNYINKNEMFRNELNQGGGRGLHWKLENFRKRKKDIKEDISE